MITRPPASLALCEKSRPAATGGRRTSRPLRPWARSRLTRIDADLTKATSRTTSYCWRSISPSSSPLYGSPKTSVALPTDSKKSLVPATSSFDPARDASLRSVSLTRLARASGRGRASAWSNHR